MNGTNRLKKALLLSLLSLLLLLLIKYFFYDVTSLSHFKTLTRTHTNVYVYIYINPRSTKVYNIVILELDEKRCSDVLKIGVFRF